MVALTRTGQVISWGRSCSGRLGSDQPLDQPTAAMHATVQAAARLATPHTRASGAIVVTGGGRPLRTGTVAASSGGGGGAKVERDAASEMRGVLDCPFSGASIAC